MEQGLGEPIEKKEYTIVKYVLNRIKKNKNFICSIIGPTGSGKSWTALSFAEFLDAEFDIDRVVFRARDLMELINSGKLKSGSVIVWDEAGIDLSNRNWQSVMNKVINYLLQTFRHKNFILIFTVPYLDFIDSASRKMFHAEFETAGINVSKKTCMIKPKLLQYNSGMQKTYKKYLKVRKQSKGIIKVRKWAVPKPSNYIIKEYEEKKLLFTKDLNEDIELSLNSSGQGKDQYKIRWVHRDVYIAWHILGKRNGIVAKALSTKPENISSFFKTMDKAYPEWRNDEKMLGDLNNKKVLKLLSPKQLKFLDKDKKLEK